MEIEKEVTENYLKPLREKYLERRVYEEGNRSRLEGEFHRDYSRIMYSSSFRRLQGKMQLLGIKNDQFFRNRLTHSLEVAQIASSIAHNCGYEDNEINIVKAGALAHDIGNPPFGHAGENYLNKLFLDIGGFEGNAQSLRILTSIEKKKPDFRGLNLTYRVLLSVVKYFKRFNSMSGDKQKFIYNDDYDVLEKFIDQNDITHRTIDVQIVDIADEIAYAAHDLEDGLRVKAFTIDEVLHDYKQSNNNDDIGYKEFEKIVEESKEKAGYKNCKIDSTEYSKLFRQELLSKLINTLINDVGLIKVNQDDVEKRGTKQAKELGLMNYGVLASSLKRIVFQCINHNDEVYSYEQEGKKF